MIELSDRGLYCAAGDFYIDPWEPVERAIVTHAHADRLHAGSSVYVATKPSVPLMRGQLGDAATIESVDYGATIIRNGVQISLHPAGHIPGSAQVRIEHAGEVWVISGHAKLDPDPTCEPFESLRCHTYLIAATFGLPVFRWRPQSEIFAEIQAWWRDNQSAGRASVLFAHPLGKAQRVLAALDGPLFAHPDIERVSRVYRELGIALPPAPSELRDATQALILAPPMPSNAPWLKQFGPVSTAQVSGWMRVRGTRRRRSLDRGFVLSDHADWPSLLSMIESSGAEHVRVTEGFRAPFARWLAEQGKDAQPIDTRLTAQEEA